MFMVAGFLITMGTLGDRIGRRKLLLIGATTFGISSLVFTFSTSLEMLIGARALLGVAGATLAPSILESRPFPQVTTGELPRNELCTKYRGDMLSGVGVSIFIFGNKQDQKTGKTIGANGMKEEFDISINNGAIPIPVGATGFTTHELWEITPLSLQELFCTIKGGVRLNIKKS
ncbi:Major Facilitator Superfamily protein [Gracilibacillus orientalis]|uniref:Major Facilitator Superfamily protein n=1 Tax=Gracilibacillus orientalis TaxID=334253 RepID=A0A1I4Q556_9BACI|nr:Major Facilitator Superfamily protein [Gracilibacillus orientalis]